MMKSPRPWSAAIIAAAISVLMLGAATPGAVADIGQRALVQRDDTLRVGVKTVRLYGVYIPRTPRTCRTGIRPSRCTSRAVLELDRKINSFVFCEAVEKFRDGSVSAFCRVRSRDPTFGPREDLGLYLIRRGWAVAAPGAPFEYQLHGEIARDKKRGIWGFQVGRSGVP